MFRRTSRLRLTLLLLGTCMFKASAPSALLHHNSLVSTSRYGLRSLSCPFLVQRCGAACGPSSVWLGGLSLRGGSDPDDPDHNEIRVSLAEPPTEEQAAEIRASLEGILVRLMHPDSATIRAAEEELASICSDPVVAEQLASIALDRDEAPERRQLAAILMRQRMAGVWDRMDEARQDAFQVSPCAGRTHLPPYLPPSYRLGLMSRDQG